MEVRVNGQILVLPPDLRLADLLAGHPVAGRYAVEINGDIVPRSAYGTQRLKAGDRVEIVQAVGGG